LPMSEEYEPDSPIMTSETPLLSGSTATLTGGVTLSGTPSASDDYEYVTGPDGQLYAIRNEPFVWKQFFIGLGIPVLFVIMAWAVMMAAESTDPWDDTIVRDSNLSKNSETAYMGTVSLDDIYAEDFEYCYSQKLRNVGTDIWCDYQWTANEGEIIIYREVYTENGDWNQEDVGVVYTNNGTVIFDDGNDYGSTIEFSFYFDDYSSQDTYDILFGLSTILCWLGPISGIGLAIYGFAAGGKAMGIGALTSVVVVPAIFVIGCFALLLGGGF